ncbi:MAG TPA: hypothetical protein VD905_18090, partial [Flavobacteriales bacterium]|nr:hypothetical protein [Flavobacteriales bacterium]
TPPDSVLKKWGFTGDAPMEFWNQESLDKKLQHYYGKTPLPKIDFNKYHVSGELICMQCFISCDKPECHANACKKQFAWLLVDNDEEPVYPEQNDPPEIKED